MNAKRIFMFFLTCTALLVSCALPVYALSAEFSLTTEYSDLSVGDTLDVIISVNNIEDKDGLVLAEFNLHYDNKCFDIKEWKSNKPDAWKNSEKDESTADTVDKPDQKSKTEVDSTFEELSVIVEEEEDAYLKCAYMYTGPIGKGILEDSILFTTVTFEVISPNANGKAMHLDNTKIVSDSNQTADCNEANLTINLNGKPTEEKIPGKKTYNGWKVLIAIVAIIVIFILGFYINKKVNQKKA